MSVSRDAKYALRGSGRLGTKQTSHEIGQIRRSNLENPVVFLPVISGDDELHHTSVMHNGKRVSRVAPAGGLADVVLFQLEV